MALSDKISIPRLLYFKTIIISILITIDLIGIFYLIFFNVAAQTEEMIVAFDLFVCAILLIEFAINFYISKPKKVFLKHNWLDLVASIPFDLILPFFFSSLRFIKLFRILKILRISALFGKYFKTVNEFIRDSNLDKILSGVVITIITFTLILYYFGPSYGFFDDFYFVVVTLTTVGYGDVVPQTFPEKLVTLVLIFAGIFIFSTITAAISSYFTNKLISADDDDVESDIRDLNDKMDSVKDEMKSMKTQNQKLHEEISEIKEILKNK